MSNPMLKKPSLVSSLAQQFLSRLTRADIKKANLPLNTSPMFVTLTGVDASVGLSTLESLSEQFPFAEWAVLYSPKHTGRENRYPPVSTLHKVFSALRSVHVALHICGDGIGDLLERKPEVTKLVEMIAARSGRVQLNFNQARKQFDLEKFSCLMNEFPSVVFITQHHNANKDVWKALRDIKNHAVLFDSSGGRGIEQNNWPASFDGVFCGYAGGLGPTRITEELPKIAVAARGTPFWIDMETRIRNEDDLFDIQRATMCLKEAEAFASQRQAI